MTLVWSDVIVRLVGLLDCGLWFWFDGCAGCWVAVLVVRAGCVLCLGLVVIGCFILVWVLGLLVLFGWWFCLLFAYGGFGVYCFG